jgi:restriction system protein
MGRRKDGRALGDLFETTARFPWWFGVALAVVSYGFLHWYAAAPLAPMAKPGLNPEIFFKGIAKALQYILPIVFIAGAIASEIGRMKRKGLITHVAAGESSGVVADMTWQEFEMLVGEAFRLEGYTVQERLQGGPDGGVDIVLRKGSEKYLVQCKQWRALKVGVVTLRELYGVMAASGAAGGFVVTSGRFTDEALQFASGRNVELIDGGRLFAMIRRVRATRPSAAGPASADRIEPTIAPTVPPCPKCGGTMVKRTAQRGSNAGKQFWGCLAFPKCTGVRPVA